jgi:hypothetical protein
MFGYDVEVYVEDNDMQGVSGGVYSVMNDEWIKKPSKEKMKTEKAEIIKQSKKWMRLIDNLIKNGYSLIHETVGNKFYKKVL